jgi:ribosome maturation factor RimP
MSVQTDVASAIVPIIEADGNYLEEVKIVNAGKRKLITVIVDGDTYLNLDQVAAVSRAISETLENLPALGDSAFTLEVTSPGIDRPLTLPRHWKKNIGKLVKVDLIDGTKVEGRISNLDGEKVSLEGADFDMKNVKKALLQIEFKK